jgi:hypothetical protein
LIIRGRCPSLQPRPSLGLTSGHLRNPCVEAEISDLGRSLLTPQISSPTARPSNTKGKNGSIASPPLPTPSPISPSHEPIPSRWPPSRRVILWLRQDRAIRRCSCSSILAVCSVVRQGWRKDITLPDRRQGVHLTLVPGTSSRTADPTPRQRPGPAAGIVVPAGQFRPPGRGPSGGQGRLDKALDLEARQDDPSARRSSRRSAASLPPALDLLLGEINSAWNRWISSPGRRTPQGASATLERGHCP